MAAPPPPAPFDPPSDSAGLARLLDLLTAHLVVALVALVGVGGATRVMEAGLACPDWPLCYGSLLPARRMTLQVFLEWFHRLDAFLVGLALLLLGGLAARHRRSLPAWLLPGALAALVLVAVQGGLGALTVTGLLAAPTVTAHLATALLLVLLMAALHQGLRCTVGHTKNATSRFTATPSWWRLLVVAAALPLLGQCLLGGAMASRWAADRCLDSGEACRWLLLHRIGAWPALGGLLLLGAGALWLSASHLSLRLLAAGVAGLALLQVALGILTLRLQLAVPAVTVAHQLLAALLVAMVGALWGRTFARQSDPYPSLPPLEVVHG